MGFPCLIRRNYSVDPLIHPDGSVGHRHHRCCHRCCPTSESLAPEAGVGLMYGNVCEETKVRIFPDTAGSFPALGISEARHPLRSPLTFVITILT